MSGKIRCSASGCFLCREKIDPRFLFFVATKYCHARGRTKGTTFLHSPVVIVETIRTPRVRARLPDVVGRRARDDDVGALCQHLGGGVLDVRREREDRLGNTTGGDERAPSVSMEKRASSECGEGPRGDSAVTGVTDGQKHSLVRGRTRLRPVPEAVGPPIVRGRQRTPIVVAKLDDDPVPRLHGRDHGVEAALAGVGPRAPPGNGVVGHDGYRGRK